MKTLNEIRKECTEKTKEQMEIETYICQIRIARALEDICTRLESISDNINQMKLY